MNKKPDNKKVRKKVIFYSFGVLDQLSRSYWPRNPPGNGVSRHIIDVRSFIPDPYHLRDTLKGNGINSKRVKRFIDKEAERNGIFHFLNISVKNFIQFFYSDDTCNVCEIFFFCVGGWQRSPFFAQYYADWVSNAYKEDLEIEVNHLSMHEWTKKK